MSLRKILAEFFGTGILTFVVLLSSGNTFFIPTALLAALTLCLFVYSIGSVSGCHINPAVTIGLWSIKKIKTPLALQYIISQIAGAILALSAITMIAGEIQNPLIFQHWSVGLGETVGTMLFAFGIASVVFDKVHPAAGGLVIGGSLLLGISVASLIGSPGILNPAVSIGVKAYSVETLVLPIIGSIIGMQLYKLLHQK